MKNNLLSAIALCLMVSPALAREQIYECTINPWGIGGWVPESLQFRLSSDQSSADVIDPFIQFVHEKPIQVDVTPHVRGQVRMRWQLELPSTTMTDLLVEYRLTFDPSRSQAVMRVQLTDDGGERGGRGPCAPLK